MVAKFYNEGAYQDSFIGMVRLAHNVYPFRERPLPEDSRIASNLLFLTADWTGKVFDCSPSAKHLLGIRSPPSSKEVDTFFVQDIHTSYNPAELFNEVKERSVYVEQIVSLADV